LVVVVDATLVATLVAVTATPGSRPPDTSVMRPVMPPRKSCAETLAAAASSAAMVQTNRFIAPPSMIGRPDGTTRYTIRRGKKQEKLL
jgi:hypothetical protein